MCYAIIPAQLISHSFFGIERATDVLRLAWERASTACDFDIPPISPANVWSPSHEQKVC